MMQYLRGVSCFKRPIHLRSRPGTYSNLTPAILGTSTTPDAIEIIIGFAKLFNSEAIALALVKCPIPIPLLVARIMVGFSMKLV
jgi:hypothetical protein